MENIVVFFNLKIVFSIVSAIFYIIEQDISIYVTNSRPNGSTKWADIFYGHSWLAGGVLG